MAFTIFYKIPFVSLRSGTVYTVNIYKDATLPTGYPLTLKGASEPFTTDENSDEDMFTPIRTQSGYIRIVDDGYGRNASDTADVAFDWHDIAAKTATDRPVTLTAGNTVVWQGFIQAQNFGSELNNPFNEIEFPVQCPIGAIATYNPSTTTIELKNFAYLLDSAISKLPAPIAFDTIKIQGGANAQQWLLKKYDWQNFLDDGTNEEDELVAGYNYQEMLEDMCKYWGWTLRTKGTTLYLVCADVATAEPNFLTMTRAQLTTMAGGTTAGDTTDTFATDNFDTDNDGDIFASTNNDDSYCLGYDKAVVKSDCNKQEQIIEVFPVSVEKSLEAQGYTWVGEDGSTAVGYYTTPNITTFNSTKLVGGTDGTSYDGYFSRRQIYSDEDSDKPSVCDVISLRNTYTAGTRRIFIQSKKMMAFGKGSLKISGTIYHGAIRFDNNTNENFLHVRVGVGTTYGTAKWFYIEQISLLHPTGDYGWYSTMREFNLIMSSGSVKGPGRYYDQILVDQHVVAYDAIPIDNIDDGSDGLFGYLYIDFLGATVDGGSQTAWPWNTCDIADFKVEYTRDETWIPTTAQETRGRSILNERASSREYTADNNNQSTGDYNVDLLFASDDNMEYGYGLLCNPDGSYMTTAPFGTTPTNERPEQHLANRIANFWSNSKRMIPCEVRANVVADITPKHKVTLKSTTFTPLAISRNWRDDVLKLTLMQI